MMYEVCMYRVLDFRGGIIYSPFYTIAPINSYRNKALNVKDQVMVKNTDSCLFLGVI